MATPLPQFGTQHANRACVLRPSAYVVLSSADGKVAIVRAPGGVFLPGGGLLAGESPEQAVARETREECGLRVEDLAEVGRADQFVYAKAEATFFLKRCTFFRGQVAGSEAPADTDHHLEWIPYSEGIRILSHESHQWAIAEERRLTCA